MVFGAGWGSFVAAGVFDFGIVEAAPGASFGASAVLVASTAGLSGTPGSLCAKTSAARVEGAASATACFSSFFVITSTSSSLARLAAGLIRMFKNTSDPGVTFVTVPRGNPFGKMRSPPLVRTRSPDCTASSLITRSSTISPVAVPFELSLPADAAPTAVAVHSSLVYFVAARLRYAGSGGPERVRCPIVVVNAD